MPFTEIAPGVLQVDTLLGGWAQVTAGYLITGTEPVLVETGSQTSVPTLLAALDELGVAAAFPKATVYVHELGAQHLVDPTRLVRSSALVYGSLMDTLYGGLTPTDAARLHVLEDGEDIVVSANRRLTTVDSPGHAKHHLALHDSDSGLLFAGDAVGVRLPGAGFLRPATPPPDFDLDKAVASLHRFAERSPAGVALAHFGLVPADPKDTLAEAEEILTRWAEVATRAWQAGEDITEALTREFAPDMTDVDPEAAEALDTLTGIHSNAAGFQRWLDKGGHSHLLGVGGHAPGQTHGVGPGQHLH
jgi:glyoxylase-like metal-dependent hydrolase (beta-lactamase superfamily II)